MELDTTGLKSRMFDGFAATSSRRYVYLCNMQTGVSRWSKKAFEYFDIPGEYFINAGEIWGSLIHPDDREVYFRDIEDVFAGRKDRHDLEYKVKNRKGEYVICSCRGVVMKGENGEPDLFIGTITNHGIADLIDAVTNLNNIHSFWDYIKKTKVKNEKITVLLVGIRNFSDINSVYGYDFGDKVLRNVGELLDSICKDRGRLFRMDGSRFSICFTDTDNETVTEVYEEIRNTFVKGVLTEDIRLALYSAGGAVVFGSDYEDGVVQTSARYALQQSKYERGGDLVFFNREMYLNNQKNLELIEQIRHSISDDFSGFYLCYQPIVSATEEQVIGAEALLRWRKEPFGEVPPGIFIPWLENDPSFYKLGNWVIKTAMTEMLPMIVKNSDFLLSVNVAYPQLSRTGFAADVLRMMDDVGYPSRNLCLELTERCRQLETSFLKSVMEKMRESGVRFAIDDFGTGFSSLNLLGEIPIDSLKIDRGFVAGIEHSKANQAVVQAVTNCATDLGVHVCMEGLEERKTIDFVKRYALYSYQGYYYSRPICLADFMKQYGDSE